MHDAQTESCVVNLLIECVANRCGCNKDEAHLHLPAWIAADVPLQLRKLVAPWLCIEIDNVMVAIESCKDNVELTSKCLNTAKGCLRAT